MGGEREPRGLASAVTPAFHRHGCKKRLVILLAWRADRYATYVRPLSAVHRRARRMFGRWTLTLGAKDEMQIPVPPLTTATSSREYLASGTFTGSLISSHAASESAHAGAFRLPGTG